MKQTDTNENVMKLNLDEIEGVSGGTGVEEGVRVSCKNKNCSNPVFTIPLGRSSGKCPECGVTVFREQIR